MMNSKELYNMVIELQGLNYTMGQIESEIAKRIGKSARQVRRYIGALRESWSVPVSTRPTWDNAVCINGDAVALYADLHCDFHDGEFIERAMELQRKRGVTQAIIPGDAIDAMLYSSYIPDPESGFIGEVDAVRAILNNIDVMSPDGVVWCEGNHEARIVKTLKRGIGIRELADLAGISDSVITSDYRCVYWNDWLVCHPDEYSRVPLAVPRKFLAKFHCHVAVAHQHRYAFFNDGMYYGLELGMMADPNRLGYYKKSASSGAFFQQSFTILYRKGSGYEHETIFGLSR